MVNIRWSWGSVRESDSAVFLRVWQDECKSIEGRRFARVISVFEGSEDRLGHAERKAHVSLIRQGAPSYMIMCRVKDPMASPRAIAGFNKDDIFVGGQLLEADGYTWLEITARKPRQSLASKPIKEG